MFPLATKYLTFANLTHAKMKNVLIFNQSSELYGSDKALLELLENYPEDYLPIVVLANEGPLKDILLSKGIRVIKAPVMKLTRSGMTPWGIVKLMGEFIKGFRIIRRETKTLDINFVHSNSIAVFMGAFYAFFMRKKHLWHVHEIVEHPKIVAKSYPKIVSWFSDAVAFNSKAAFNAFQKEVSSIGKKSLVVYNGQTRLVPQMDGRNREQFRKLKFGCDENDCVIGLIGRISRWKGQMLLLESFKNLLATRSDIFLVFVGSTPSGQEYFLDCLVQKVGEYGISDRVRILSFDPNIWLYYDAVDIVAVPSTDPEPFGLVATEAMLSKRPVVGSGFGGLAEVIENDVTGFWFEPGNVGDLSDKLRKLIENPELRTKMGVAGLQRVEKHFSTEQYIAGIAKAYAMVVEP